MPAVGDQTMTGSPSSASSALATVRNASVYARGCCPHGTQVAFICGAKRTKTVPGNPSAASASCPARTAACASSTRLSAISGRTVSRAWAPCPETWAK